MKNSVLLIGGDAFDLQEACKRFQTPLAPVRFCGDSVTAAQLEEALFTVSFFDKTLVVIEVAHELQDKALALCLSFAKKPNPQVALVMQSSKKTELAKHFPCVAIADVKPWEKQAKLAEWIVSYLSNYQVKIEPALANFIASRVGQDRFLMSCELEKLLCYLGDKKEVEQRDCLAILHLESQETLWALSDAFLQRDTPRAIKLLYSLLEREVHAFVLVRALRSACHQALEMCALADAQVVNPAEHFPQLRGKTFEKAFKTAREAGTAFLTKALVAIDKTENGLKDSPFDETALLMKLFV